MICVCYLVRFRKGKKFVEDLSSLKKFYFSYCSNKAGIIHKLFILIKGPMANESIRIIMRILPTNIPIIKLPDEGYDLGSFTEFARHRAESHMFLLNQHSIILTKNWLKIYDTVLKKTKSRIVASTASMASHADFYTQKISNQKFCIKHYTINILKKIKAQYYSFIFPKYPNPHIRTNALLIETSLWLEYFQNLNIKTKLQCHEIESGKKSFYVFLKKKKEKVPIVRNDGKYVTSFSKWKNFVPFRNFNQKKKLIISDNQTRFYQNANIQKKIELYEISWRN